jgi:hypothetical protein
VSLPAGLSTFTLNFGGPNGYIDALGDLTLVGATGKLSAVDPSSRQRINLLHDPTGQPILDDRVLIVVGEDGKASVGPIPHTGQPGVSPTGWAYRVEWDLAAGLPSPGNLTFVVPSGSSVNFDSLVPAATVPTVAISLPNVTSVAGLVGAVAAVDLAAAIDDFLPGGYTDEQARDAIGTALVAGAGLAKTVNDAGDTITLSVADGGITVAKLSFDPATQAELDALATATTSSLASKLDTSAAAELARDTLGTALVAGAGLTKTVDDPGDTITFDVVGKAPLLTPTTTKTATYTAVVGDLAMMDVPGGGAVLNLPAAPADKSQVGYRAIGATIAVPLTVNRGGSDTIGTAGATSATVVLPDEVVVLQYNAANTRWLAVANVKSQAALDGQYALAAIVGRAPAGRYLTGTEPNAGGTLGLGVNVVLGCWIPVFTSTPVDRIGIDAVLTGVASTFVSLSLYKMRPASAVMDLILSTADLATDTAGVKEATVSATLAPGRYAAFAAGRVASVNYTSRTGKTLYEASEVGEVSDRRGGISALQVGNPTIGAGAGGWPSTLTLVPAGRVHALAIYLRTA